MVPDNSFRPISPAQSENTSVDSIKPSFSRKLPKPDFSNQNEPEKPLGEREIEPLVEKKKMYTVFDVSQKVMAFIQRRWAERARGCKDTTIKGLCIFGLIVALILVGLGECILFILARIRDLFGINPPKPPPVQTDIHAGILWAQRQINSSKEE